MFWHNSTRGQSLPTDMEQVNTVSTRAKALVYRQRHSWPLLRTGYGNHYSLVIAAHWYQEMSYKGNNYDTPCVSFALQLGIIRKASHLLTENGTEFPAKVLEVMQLHRNEDVCNNLVLPATKQRTKAQYSSCEVLVNPATRKTRTCMNSGWKFRTAIG